MPRPRAYHDVPRVVDVEQMHRLVLEGLRGTGHPTELSPLGPVLLPTRTYRRLFAATWRLVARATEALATLGDDHRRQIPALGIDPAYVPAFLPTRALERAYARCMVRPDLVIGPSGLRFLELNMGGGFGGVTETHVLHRVFGRAFSAPERRRPRVADPFPERARLLETVAAEQSRDRSVVIVGDPAEHGDDASERLFELEVRALRRRGFRAAFLRPPELADPARTERFSLGIRGFSTIDWVRRGTDPGPVRAAIADGCLMLPAQSATLLADKRILALVSEGRGCRSAADRAFVSAHVPWTRIVGDRHVDWRGRRHSLAELILGAKDDFVLKRGMGNGGQEVTIGRDIPDAAWECAVTSAMDGSSVVQEYVPAQACTLEVINEAGAAEAAAVAPVLSPILLGGRPAGCYARYIRADTRQTSVFSGDAPWNETVAMPAHDAAGLQERVGATYELTDMMEGSRA